MEIECAVDTEWISRKRPRSKRLEGGSLVYDDPVFRSFGCVKRGNGLGQSAAWRIVIATDGCRLGGAPSKYINQSVVATACRVDGNTAVG
jgi:hypothetical protein